MNLLLDFFPFQRNLEQEGMNLFLDFWPFSRILVISRFWAIFTNLRPERNERASPFFCYFHDFETTKNRTMSLFLSIFPHLRQKELSLLLHF